jgi:hypothetical protein
MKTFLAIAVTLLALTLGVSWPALRAPAPAASAQTQPGTTVTGTCDCDGFKVTATKVINASGSCTYQLTFSQTYPTAGPVHVPRGIRLTTTAPVTFQSVTGGNTGMTQVPAIVTPGSTTVQWNSSTPLPNGAPAQLLATVTVNPNGVSPQVLTFAWLDETGVVMCRAKLNLECPCKTTTATPNNPNLCAGQTTTVTLSPTPQSGAQVVWYKAAPLSNGQCPPPIVPPNVPLGWTVAQVGGNTCNTNVLTQTTCYQAVVTDGPNCTYASNVTSVYVGQIANLGTVTQTPPGTQFCKTAGTNGTVTFNVTDPFLLANPGLITWLGPNGQPVASGVTTYTTTTLTATAANDCPFQFYPYTIKVTDPGCGVQTRTFPITVWHEPAASPPVAAPAGPLCYDQATKINLPVSCGTVSLWEQSTVSQNGPWTPVAGAGSTVNYWTPELLQTTWYRATVANGVCPPYTTTALQVQVKPQLAVTLTSSGTMLCPGAVTLTAQTPTGYPPPLTYKWYRNGVLVATTNSPTFTATQPGTWRVVVTDPACGSAKSNVVRVYPRPVVNITGPCGTCQGKTITLKANLIGGDPNCAYTYNWTSTATGSASLGNGSTLTVTAPPPAAGASVTYSVTVNCSGCTVVATHTVTSCPP